MQTILGIWHKKKISIIGLISLAILNAQSHATNTAHIPPEPATTATQAANAAVQQALPFNEKSDFKNAQRGFIARPDTLTIKDDKGNIIWDLEKYKQYITLDNPAPNTVNPSLWRNAQLNMQYGLFKVADRIYQVRGYDLSNLTLIQGDTGWILLDVLLSAETAKAALEFANKKLGQRPVIAVIYSHSHADHYGGIRGVIGNQNPESIRIIAPEGFTNAAVSENVIAGNAMDRRSVYMYGSKLPRNPQGGVNGGLGQTLSAGSVTMIEPTDLIKKTGDQREIDGVVMEFQMTPSTEAPAEMNTYFPQFNAMWMAENTTNTMHNILTLRGAQVRDALQWAKSINDTIDRYGDKAQVKFQSHHWPIWGNPSIVAYLKKQANLYKYIHDQSVRLMNQGYIGSEIAEMIQLPPELDQFWPNRGYYGTLRHNARSVYQRYMGWYSGNPSDLNDLPPEMAAKKYIEYMGGEQAVLRKAQVDFDKGEYRWVAMALKHLVFANPNNTTGKQLLANTYEQLGYQAESGPWRSIYLQGADELRHGVDQTPVETANQDTLEAMTPEMLFDYLAVKLNGPKAFGKNIVLNINFTDIKQPYSLVVEHGVLNYFPRLASDPNATLTLEKATLNEIQTGQITPEQAIAKGLLAISGNRDTISEFVSMLDSYPCCFNIVTP